MRNRSTYENMLVLILAAGGAVAALDGQALYYLSPYLAKDLRLNNASIGLVSSIVVVTWALSAYGVGSLSDRSGRRKRYLVGAFVMFAVCSGLSGLATTFGLLFAARALIGLAEGPVIPISQSIMMAASSPHRRGFNMGIVQNLGSQLVGSMLGPLIVVKLADTFNWHAAFFLAGIPGLIVAAAVGLYVHDPRAPQPATQSAVASTRRDKVRTMLGYANIRVCVVVSCFVVAWYFLVLTYLPLYCVNVLHMSPARMSIVLGCTGAAGVLSSVLVTGVSDRIGRKPALVMFAAIGVLTPIGALYAGSSYTTLLALVFAGGLVPGTTALLMGTIPLETVPAHFAASASGLILAAGSVVGGFSGPAIAGVLADRYGLNVPMWIALAMAVLAAATAALGLRETAPRVLARRQQLVQSG